jgi:hypothetical protein
MFMTRNRIIGCLAILGSLVHAGSSSAADGIKSLIYVSQLMSDNANDPPSPPPPPPKTIVGHFWEGSFQSDRSAYHSGIRISVNSQAQEYIEQDSLVASVIHRTVDPAGQLALIGYDPLQGVYISVSARALDWTSAGEATAMEGEYQIFRFDRLGRKLVLDQGGLGIIAILIGL